MESLPFCSRAQVALHEVLSPTASPFDRLGLPTAACDSAQLRNTYRIRALLLHPDKCQHPKAKLAFQLLSEAFEKLSDLKEQRLLLERLASNGKGFNHPRRQRRAPRSVPTHPQATNQPSDPQGGSEQWADEEDNYRCSRKDNSWWDVGFSEFERRLRQREAESGQAEAVEAAIRAGSDPLDAFMESMLKSATQTERQHHAADRVDGHPQHTSKSRGKCAPPAGNVQKKHRPDIACKPGQLLLATGEVIQVATSELCQRGQGLKTSPLAAALLADLDSDGSEMSS